MKEISKKIILQILLISIFIVNTVYCGIRIAQPDSLASSFNDEDIHASYGDFGQIDLGFEALGTVWIMPRENNQVEPPKNYACNSLDQIKIMKDSYNFADFNIVLVEKGDCSFPEMARQVQKIGGDMILIINSEPGPIENFKIKDDGTGNSLRIPIAMISYNDGKKILDYIINHPKENVYLSIEIGLNTRDKVSVEFFTNILDKESISLLAEFKTYYELLKNDIDFNPVYLTPTVAGLTRKEQIDKCLFKQFYCITGQPENAKTPVAGFYLVYDSIFHQCIYKNTKGTYFSFLEKYMDECFYSEEYELFCGLDQFSKNLKELILSCVFGSFGSEYLPEWNTVNLYKTNLQKINENNNQILIDNRLKENRYHINYYPGVVINDKKVEGRISASILFDNICSSFKTKPTACKDHTLRQTNLSQKGIAWYEVILIVVVVLLVNFFLYVLIKKYIVKRIMDRIDVDKNDLSGEINTVVNSYFNLRDLETKNTSSDEQNNSKSTNDLGDIDNFIGNETNTDTNQISNNQDSNIILTNNIPSNNNQ